MLSADSLWPMSKLLKILALAGAGWSGLANASAPCPPRETGSYPWNTNKIMKGDLWAWVILEVGKDGKPGRCLMGDNNIRDRDLRFFACKAFTDDWKPGQPITMDASGKAVVKRFFIMPGPEHEKARKQARKRFFAENPNERPECYPE